MAGDPLKPVTAGERFKPTARGWNLILDHVRRGQPGVPGTEAIPGHIGPGSGIMPIRNESAGARERYDVLFVNGVVWGPTDIWGEPDETFLLAFQNQQVLKGVEPYYPNQYGHGKIAVLLAPLEEQRVGWACVSGVVPVKVDVLNENDDFAELKDGTTGHLESRNKGSAFILWREGGTGVQWALVLLGGPCDPLGGVFKVHVAIDGGVAGGHDACCTWTYTVRDCTYDSQPPLGTGMTPSKPRIPCTEYEELHTTVDGLGCYNALGEFCLLEVLGEIPVTRWVAVVTQVRHDPGGEYVQVKTRNIRALEMSEESEWT